MKKIYIIPETELIQLSPKELMVPNQMSDPTFGANCYDSFAEEEEDEEKIWSENHPDKLMDKL